VSAADVAIRCAGLSVAFGPRRGGTRAIEDVSFEVRRGEVFGVAGESGSGKSTLGRVLLGLVRRSGGDAVALGARIPPDPRRYPAALRRRIQPVFQDPGGALDPMRTVADALDEPLRLRTALAPGERAARARHLLEQVGLAPAHLARYPHQLSGGQKQRVSIARALAADPDVLILDEPLSALDVSTQAQVLGLLARIREQRGLTYLVISHDLEVLRRIATRVLVLERGRAVESGPAAEVFGAPRHPYTQRLVDSILSLDPAAARAALGG
jgi:peptide/nickel transport system ATP-binding protein